MTDKPPTKPKAPKAPKELTETHTYHHFDPLVPKVYVKVVRNTKGFNVEAAISDCATVDQAISLADDAMKKLQAHYPLE